MKIIVVIENKSNSDLISEHGLCIYIEYNNKKYLLDSGSSDKFMENAKKLNIDLKDIDFAVLSHNHYDHSRGYETFFNVNSKAKLYARKDVKNECYGKAGFIKTYIGMPKNLQIDFKEKFVYVDGDYEIEKGVWIIPHKTPGLEARGRASHMYIKRNRQFVLDNFSHEQSLVFEVKDGLVVLNSCSHGGVDNIVKEVESTFKDKKVIAVLGGFHLMGMLGVKTLGCKPKKVKELGEFLNNTGINKIYTGHCTGDPAFKILKEELGDKLEYLHTGKIIKID